MSEQRTVIGQKKLVQEQFGRTAKAYVSSKTHGNSETLAKLAALLELTSSDVALDIATGGGHVAKAMADQAGTVFATDLTPAMLTETRRHLRDESHLNNVCYVLADAEELPFLDETFDVVTCRIAPHHFPNPEQFVRESARVLKPGGRFLLVDNTVPEDGASADWFNSLERLRDPSHVRCLSVSQWTLWLQTAGLELTLERTSSKTFDFEPWCQRMVTSPQQYQSVVDWIANAPSEVKSEFNVIMNGNHIQSFNGLEWLALCRKTVVLA